MSAPCFGEDFYSKSKEDFDRMVQVMKGVVAASRAAGDEAIRQVSF